MNDIVAESTLGKKVSYIAEYQPDLLFPIPRAGKRAEIGIGSSLPFKGADVWNAFELSWLNAQGKPLVALGEFIFPCESPNIIESKSFKLYLNSFNNTKFNSLDEVVATLQRDLSAASGSAVGVKMFPLTSSSRAVLSAGSSAFSSIYLDTLDIECDTYQVQPNFLITTDNLVSEVLYSDLLKSNCLVTGQPDWASIQISYSGKQIDHRGLLKYLISFRDHNEFHEQCVERIFADILRKCSPETLTIEARYTRRGGLDINPFRTTEDTTLPMNERLCRQ